MGLEWCKLIDTESGWVSYKYLAFVRIIKWYYNHVTSLYPDKPFQETLTIANAWTLPACKECSKAHGYDNDGNATNLRNMMLELKSNSGDAPTL